MTGKLYIRTAFCASRRENRGNTVMWPIPVLDEGQLWVDSVEKVDHGFRSRKVCVRD